MSFVNYEAEDSKNFVGKTEINHLEQFHHFQLFFELWYQNPVSSFQDVVKTFHRYLKAYNMQCFLQTKFFEGRI